MCRVPSPSEDVRAYSVSSRTSAAVFFDSSAPKPSMPDCRHFLVIQLPVRHMRTWNIAELSLLMAWAMYYLEERHGVGVVSVWRSRRTATPSRHDRPAPLCDLECAIHKPRTPRPRWPPALHSMSDIISGWQRPELTLSDSGTHKLGVRGEALKNHTDQMNCVAFSSDSQAIASGPSDSALRQWNVESGSAKGVPQKGAHASAVVSLEFSPDGKISASRSK